MIHGLLCLQFQRLVAFSTPAVSSSGYLMKQNAVGSAPPFFPLVLIANFRAEGLKQVLEEVLTAGGRNSRVPTGRNWDSPTGLQDIWKADSKKHRKHSK